MKTPKGYEKSKFDNDKGVKEGSKEDMARDKKAIPKFEAAQKGGKIAAHHGNSKSRGK
jgi:hypothetical protein